METKEAHKYFVRVATGLLEAKHVSKMGSSIWLFLWLIDKTTYEENGHGIVLGGKPVTYKDVKSLGLTKPTYYRNIETLRKHGYISTKRTPAGLIMVVDKSKKRRYKFVDKSKSDLSKVSNRVIKNDDTSYQNRNSNIRLDKDKTKIRNSNRKFFSNKKVENLGSLLKKRPYFTNNPGG